MGINHQSQRFKQRESHLPMRIILVAVVGCECCFFFNLILFDYWVIKTLSTLLH